MIGSPSTQRVRLNALYSCASLKCETVPRVSETDAVVGFLSTAIAAVSPAPVRRIAYVFGVCISFQDIFIQYHSLLRLRLEAHVQYWKVILPLLHW